MEKNNIPLFDRDLSWLSFNYRVLMEAGKAEVPVYEKIKFLAIFSSNLDEFFRVRFANLKSLQTLKKKKDSVDFVDFDEKILANILKIVKQQQIEFGRIYEKIILPELEQNGIRIWFGEELSEVNTRSLDHYFKTRVLAFLQPIKINSDASNTVFLQNRALYFAIKLKSGNQERIEILNIPSDHLPRFVELDTGDNTFMYMFLDDMVRLKLNFLYPKDEILGVWSIKLNRDAELYIEDEFSGDLVQKITKHLERRNIGAPSRFLFDGKLPDDVLKILRKVLFLTKDELVPGGRYHNFFDFFELPNPKAPKLQYEKWPSLMKLSLENELSMLKAIERGDYLLHFPYESYDYVLRFFNEAAFDSEVKEIRTTMYRIASNSLIANALISASKNGKKVIVFMELKARFDEENNIKWAKAMENAGIKIIYSIPGLKVHAKVALVIKERHGETIRLAFFGTGNFNEKTAGLYADHGLFTAHPQMTIELEQMLRYLHKKKKEPELSLLLISQFNMQERFIEMLDREISNSLAGSGGHVIIKLNNLEDPVMIAKLYEASQAGVKVELIIRGICRLIPEKKRFSENITVRRIVDRYLEHARIFWFHNNGNSEVFMGSADWMRRNLYFRIEVIFPILNIRHKNEIEKNLEIQLNDNFKAVRLDQKLNNVAIEPTTIKRSAQQDFYKWLDNRNKRENKINDTPEKRP